MKKTMTPESNTDPKEKTVSGRLHKLVKPYNAYVGLKHLQPDLIRDIRLAFDLGVTAEELVKGSKDKPTLNAAIIYMRDNPRTGVVSKWDGFSYHFEA